MPHRHRVRDIAVQAQLSEATVDRVLHDRPGVSPRARRAVERAIADLDRQAEQVRLTGRHLVLDLVMQAPVRFTALVHDALETEAGHARPAVIRLRSHLEEAVDPGRAAAVLDRLRQRGSDGVLVKAPDHPEVRSAVDALVEAGIPVVTLATDLRGTRRHVAVGLDHVSAGRTAAYLLSTIVSDTDGVVLVPVSRAMFTGEETRATAFVEAISTQRPRWQAVTIDGSDGLDATIVDLVRAAVADVDAPVLAVYSPGGANRGVLTALDDAGISLRAFVAHDLDSDNLDLLRAGRLTAVLHHDVRVDARRAIKAVLQLQGLAPGAPASLATPVGVVTPHNIPSRL